MVKRLSTRVKLGIRETRGREAGSLLVNDDGIRILYSRHRHGHMIGIAGESLPMNTILATPAAAVKVYPTSSTGCVVNRTDRTQFINSRLILK